MIAPLEALDVELVDALDSDGRVAANPPCWVVTLMPPMGWPPVRVNPALKEEPRWPEVPKVSAASSDLEALGYWTKVQ